MSTSSNRPATAADKASSLAQLRARIDTIDEEIHRLLIERSSIIDSLIAVKNTKASGAAFRPAREADIMRRLVVRHKGTMPVTSLEHIWREIISTFTWLQAPFSVYYHRSIPPTGMRDLARYHFGFSVDARELESPSDVVDAVAASVSDLGLVGLTRFDAAQCWWADLNTGTGPEIIARLPFVTGSTAPDKVPALVISRPLNERVTPEILVYSASWTGTGGEIASVEQLARHRDADRITALFAIPADDGEDGLRAAAAEAGLELEDIRHVGGYAAPIAGE